MNGKAVEVIITESPLLAGAIQRQSSINTMATYGHLFDYDYQNHKLCLTAKNPELIARIGYLNQPNTHVIIASDNDAQGELIAQHVKALTANARHSRIHINEVTRQGIQAALNNKKQINTTLADEAAYLRITNLKLKQIEPKGTLTTTSLTLAKSFQSRGRLNALSDYKIEHNGQRYNTRIPKQYENEIKFQYPCAANTRQLATIAAVNNIRSAHHELQELYQNGRLSYIRTDSQTLPRTNPLYPNHTSQESLQDAHYAIHNITPYQSDFERWVYKLNESSVMGDLSCMSVITPVGTFIGIDETLDDVPLTPKSELMLHLALDSDAYTSTIGRASERYESVFFKNGALNSKRVNEVIGQGVRHAPEIVMEGVKKAIEMKPRSSMEQQKEQEDRIVIAQRNKGRSIEVVEHYENGFNM